MSEMWQMFKVNKKYCLNCLSSSKGFSVRSPGERLFFSVFFYSLTQLNWIKGFHGEMLSSWFQSLLVLGVCLINLSKFWVTSGYFIQTLWSCYDPQLWILHVSNCVVDYHAYISTNLCYFSFIEFCEVLFFFLILQIITF